MSRAAPGVNASATEDRRVRAHLEGALACVRRARPSELTRAQASRRAALLVHLRRYIDAGRFPRNRVSPARTPVFVDGDGARCAVAALVEATGHQALVERVARTANLARVAALAGDAEIAAWLRDHGLMVAEAARIQPQYSAHMEADWQPTVSVIAGAQGGVSSASGAQLSLAPAVRVGVRRVERGSDAGGNSRYGSLALVAEYARSFVVGEGSANQLGLLLQWEFTMNNSDVQFYALAGPLLAVDEDAAPGGGPGAELGVGFSFRRRDVPLLFELVGQGLSQGVGATFRAGVNVGVVW